MSVIPIFIGMELSWYSQLICVNGGRLYTGNTGYNIVYYLVLLKCWFYFAEKMASERISFSLSP